MNPKTDCFRPIKRNRFLNRFFKRLKDFYCTYWGNTQFSEYGQINLKYRTTECNIQIKDDVAYRLAIFLLRYILHADNMYTSVIYCHKTTVSGECVYLMGSGHFTETVITGVMFCVTFCETTKLSFVFDDRRAFVKG